MIISNEDLISILYIYWTHYVLKAQNRLSSLTTIDTSATENNTSQKEKAKRYTIPF